LPDAWWHYGAGGYSRGIGESEGAAKVIIDQKTLDELSAQAQASPRLRMNLNFHQSLEDKCHRMLNAIEPGANIPIHRHPTKDESFVVLRGKVRSTTYNDDGSVIESVVLCAEEGRYGVDIPKGVWHKLESLESGSVVFECKEGPFVPHEVEGVMEVTGE
jgi:cupin fold WbuC family metalloprotein